MGTRLAIVLQLLVGLALAGCSGPSACRGDSALNPYEDRCVHQGVGSEVCNIHNLGGHAAGWRGECEARSNGRATLQVDQSALGTAHVTVRDGHGVAVHGAVYQDHERTHASLEGAPGTWTLEVEYDLQGTSVIHLWG